MKVAIIGAGISGLSCALELERHNITPVIFEKNNKVGDIVGFSLIWPRMFNRSYDDPLAYLRERYDVTLKPLNKIRKIVMYSPGRKAVERGSLGYIFKKGYEAYSIERQLAAMLDTQIIFNQYIDIDEIKKEYDYIIAATGFNIIGKKLGVWTDTLIAQARIANVVGSFKKTSVTMWLNTDYCKNGFCYLIPINDKQANLAMVVNGITSRETDYYWKHFLTQENISCTITDTIDSEHVCGFARPLQKDNVLFVGNAGGFTDDLIGCGSINAVESGILAAQAIAYNEDYNRLAAPIYAQMEKLHEMRKFLNTMDNKAYDRLISFLDIPILKNYIYNSPFFRISDAAPVARAFNKYIRSRSRLK